MKTLFKAALLAGLMAGAAIQPAMAQKKGDAASSAAGPIVAGLGVANIDAIRANSNAFKVAQTQRPVTYKAQIDQANTRAGQIQTQIKTLATKFDTDRRAPNANQAALQTQYTAIQQAQQAGQDEINRILAPVALSEAYVLEQINDKLAAAVTAAVAKRKITLLVSPDSVIHADNAYNLNPAILDELNVLLPSANLVPPQGWEPLEVRQQRAAQQGGAAAAPAGAARPAGAAPEGR